MTPYNSVKTPTPGRMALATAVCFVLTGVTFLAASGALSRRFRAPAVAVIGSIVVSLGAVALTGYMSGMNTYDFGALIPMAAHTATGFTLLGLGLAAFAGQKVHDEAEADAAAGAGAGAGAERGGLPRWLPVTVALGGLAATISLWQPLSAQRHAQASLPGGVWSSVPETMIAMGFAMTAMLAWVVRMALRSREHSARVEAINRRMAVEVAERSRAELTLRKTSEDLQRTLAAVRETVAQLATAGSQILASTHEQASGGREQAAAVAEVVTTVAVIADTSREAAERARGVGDSVKQVAARRSATPASAPSRAPPPP